MDRRSKIILFALALVLVGILLSELVRPRPIDWQPSYTAGSKIPFGCFVLYNELPSLFPGQVPQTVEESLYGVLSGAKAGIPSNYILINESIVLDARETEAILDHVAQGGTVFIAASHLGGDLADSLNLALYSDYGLLEGSSLLKLTHESFHKQEYPITRGNFNTHFTKVDTAQTTVLGHIVYTRKDYLQDGPGERLVKPNLIRTDFGQGYFIISSTPQVFGNYYMLGGLAPYVARTFSYLGQREPLYWDDYKKAGKAYIDSPMRFVLDQPPLVWAYYLTVLGLLLFVAFRAKRQQRIIPLVEPLGNSSVAFAQAVGSLYHQERDTTGLIQKKIAFFLAELREKYHLDSSTLDEGTMGLLAVKAGKDPERTKALIQYILQLRAKASHTEAEAMELDKKITEFKQK